MGLPTKDRSVQRETLPSLRKHVLRELLQARGACVGVYLRRIDHNVSRSNQKIYVRRKKCPAGVTGQISAYMHGLALKLILCLGVKVTCIMALMQLPFKRPRGPVNHLPPLHRWTRRHLLFPA